MKLIKKKDVFANANSEYEIPEEVQKQLFNGNAQFVIDLAQNLQLTSYSTVSLAIYLVNYFFNQKCYLHYDRFVPSPYLISSSSAPRACCSRRRSRTATRG